MTTTLPEADAVDFATYGTIYDHEPAGGSTHEPYPLRGRLGTDEFPAQAGRYHLFVSLACPFAHRTLIVRALKGLTDAVSVSVVDPIRDGRGWAFRPGAGLTLDTSGNGFTFLSQAYRARDPQYTGRVSVPLLWDLAEQRPVSNWFEDITLDLGSALNSVAGRPDLDLYPVELRGQIDELNAVVGPHLNQGVYHAGFARTQRQYEAGYREVFETLDLLEDRLAHGGPYLLGDRLTEADVRAWPTLARFDSVYHGHFKVNRQRLVDFPALWAYARRLHADPAFGGTLDLDQITRHYYGTQRHLNPRGIVPLGPVIDWSL